MHKLKKYTKGFMMVEVLVAVSIIAVSVLSAMAVSQKAVQVSRQAFHTAQAAFLLEEGAEAVRILRDNSWNNISALTAGTTYYPAFSGGTWTLSATPNTAGIFTRTVTLSGVNRDGTTGDISQSGTADAQARLVTVSISWLEGGVTITKSAQFYIMDIFS